MMKEAHIKSIIAAGIILVFPICNGHIFASEVIFSGNSLPAMKIEPEKSTGLDCVYVLYDSNGVSMSYNAESPGNVKWMRYSNLGGAFSEEVNNVSVNGNTITLNSFDGDMGYMIKDGDKTYNFWVVNYLPKMFKIDNIHIPSQQECDAVYIDIQGEGSPIHYYTINGRQETLERDIRIIYSTLVWNEESSEFRQEDITKNLASVSNRISVTPPPYCNTIFTISGDKFLKFWNLDETYDSGLFITKSVDAITTAEQVSEANDSSNRIEAETDGLGGSAPCEINFNSYVTDALIHYEWQMAEDEEFENILYRINEHDFSYTFTEQGQTYIRFIGSNSDGSCESISETYKVSIGASELLIPNVFSPNDDGVNDEWKVSYRSLLDFKCWIFDRHGHQLFHFDNPDEGWDGKHGGKKVKPGVYFYVIQATGSDGKHYKKSGDINILNYKGSQSSSSSGE